MSEFTQEEPRLGNQYDDDGLLRAYLRWRLPAKMRAQIDPELRRLGHRVITDIFALGEAAEASPPRHAPFDAWGRRVDRIETNDAWRQLDGISASEAIVATAYERANGPLSRVDQFARLYLFAPSSALYSCPLAMTDGAARFLEVHGDDSTRPVFAHLTSRDPEEFWTSGQWMTERTGGSDVGSTSTIAKCEAGDDYRLYGSKWFTSATTSQVAMTLARIEGAPAGGSGLSVFLITLRDSVGMLRNTSPGLGTSTGEIRRDSGVLPSVSSHQRRTTIPTPATPSPRRTIGGGSARRANSRRKDDVATETPTSTRVGRP